jgi:hypothetical protein
MLLQVTDVVELARLLMAASRSPTRLRVPVGQSFVYFLLAEGDTEHIDRAIELKRFRLSIKKLKIWFFLVLSPRKSSCFFKIQVNIGMYDMIARIWFCHPGDPIMLLDFSTPASTFRASAWY